MGGKWWIVAAAAGAAVGAAVVAGRLAMTEAEEAQRKGLVPVRDGAERLFWLRADAAEAFQRMVGFARLAGVRLELVSAFRSQARQDELRERWLRGDRVGLVREPVRFSQHTEGVAIDVREGDGLAWMLAEARQPGEARAVNNAFRFGFVRPEPERDPIHFQYTFGTLDGDTV